MEFLVSADSSRANLTSQGEITQKMKRLLASAMFGLFLLTPVVTVTAHPGDDQHKHEWRDTENDHWHQYLKEKHIKDHEWEKASKREQANYWKWRDAHPDAH